MALTLERINTAVPREFVALLDGAYERSRWIAVIAGASLLVAS